MARRPSCSPTGTWWERPQDRNGLRPARYYLTDDSRLILPPRWGAGHPPEHIVEKSRLRPGKMLLAD